MPGYALHDAPKQPLDFDLCQPALSASSPTPIEYFEHPLSPPLKRLGEHICIKSVLACFDKDSRSSSAGRIHDLPEGYELAASIDRRAHVAYRRRVSRPGRPNVAPMSGSHLLVLGDDFEVGGNGQSEPMGNAAAISFYVDEGRLEALTSIPGLPALYLIETPTVVVLTSDLFLLRHVDGLSLRFDPAGVGDLAYIGRPVGYRTLFAGVKMIPGGSRLVLRVGGSARIETAWRPPEFAPTTWDDYTALQSEAFGRAMSRLDLSSCVLSLSGGLDSRTTLAGLIAIGAKVPALTVSGETQCLDARTAAKLCAAYGFPHRTISLDETFRRALPDLATKASLLSGGISSIWNAAQLYTYRELSDPLPVVALSGYLGNQVGRRSTEGLTPRNADISLLDPRLIDGARCQAPPWYAEAMGPDGFLETKFLIQQESTFGNLPSYAIGNSHSVQQSPYACRSMIENLWRLPTSGVKSSAGLRVRNLKHLFLGEPLPKSFQRRYINRVGGLVAQHPVNWGWRSRGGVSPVGIALGGLALVDAVVSSRFSETPASTLTRTLGVAGLHEFRSVHLWLHRDMKPFSYDELLSRSTVDAGLFDTVALERKLDDYYSIGGRGFKEVVLALDLALAARNFGATV